ncbi:DNA damage-regulated autophagy modulator protein 1 isoform X1 [Dunckerocampus dactyliophorus]|uniref:DNA damage-regulated autophagy modulator protein 1 isoform X1 n=1 Tax=Dunckerocampus dactyliophorus TaxID=161453 RepID=UPI002404993A|nr:DNA damage-regulated autophagy modulator protein 1 isoform X1 [Dunckerocampus dactyliophorus]
MWWFMQGLCFLPVFLVVWSSSTFIVSYITAVFRRDVDVLFPYISDTAAYPPESCIFGLMTFVSACAGTATIYARFKYVEKLSEETRVVSPCLNRTTLVLGMLSCLGMCIVATFQETTVMVVHDMGALLFFISGVLYIILQCVVSYHAFPYGSSMSVCRARLAVAVIASLAFFPISCIVSSRDAPSSHTFSVFLTRTNQAVICAFFVKQTDQMDLHRNTGSKDYPFHVASAVCEWIVAFSFICFFLTYIDDFKMFTLRVRTELES